jgi:hypothetical protein
MVVRKPTSFHRRQGTWDYPNISPSSLLWLLAGGPTTTADLTRIPRTIAKEPAYKTKPKYCLVVFGPEAKTRLWLVLDGDVLYVDKNGNGDLTEKGKSLSYTKEKLDVSDPAYPLQEYRRFSVGDVVDGGRTYTKVEVGHTILKEKFEVTTDFGKEMARLRRKDPGLTRLGIHATRNGKVRIQAIGYAADSPDKAPIVHMDGPLTLKPHNVSGLIRGSKPFEFYAVVGTQGHGEDTFATLDYTEIPESAKPVVEVEFPGKVEGRSVRTSLGRC